MWVFDSSNEASGFTGYNAKKNPTPQTEPLLKKSEKKHQKQSFLKKM